MTLAQISIFNPLDNTTPYQEELRLRGYDHATIIALTTSSSQSYEEDYEHEQDAGGEQSEGLLPAPEDRSDHIETENARRRYTDTMLARHQRWLLAGAIVLVLLVIAGELLIRIPYGPGDPTSWRSNFTPRAIKVTPHNGSAEY